MSLSVYSEDLKTAEIAAKVAPLPAASGDAYTGPEEPAITARPRSEPTGNNPLIGLVLLVVAAIGLYALIRR